jgi:Glycosyl hydrolase family 57
MLRVHAFFHLNLMFSSIDEDAREAVVQRCYWPILHLAERLGKPIGIEVSGTTLHEIARIDRAWIAAARRLMNRGLVELIGSGYAQAIGPLFPAALTEWNLKLGNEVYARLFDHQPRIALINEQAYSAGLVPLYREAGYRAILMDWDMCAHAHPEWPDEWRYHTQLAQGQDTELPVIWTNTVSFQKLQRVAHGDIEMADYLRYVRSQIGPGERTIALYSNDAEVFDFRPGRFTTEAAASSASEWNIVADALSRVAEHPDLRWIAPHQAIAGERSADAFNPVTLESPAFPVPVKKQMKYNVSRWAVTGRADFELNRRCRAVIKRLRDAGNCDAALWRKLCRLCSSDFRTHITEKRFDAMLAELEKLEHEVLSFALPLAGELSAKPTEPGPVGLVRKPLPRQAGEGRPAVHAAPRLIEISGPSISAGLNPRKGLAITRLAFGNHALIGTLPHGTYDDLVYAFDWFSGTLIAEFVGRQKVTDLANVSPCIEERGSCVALGVQIETLLGTIDKELIIDTAAPSLTCRYALDWPRQELGTLRIGNFTILPNAVDPDTLYFETHNGGRRAERFVLGNHSFDHGAPVSFLVSASSGTGMSEGQIVIGDAGAAIRISATEESDAFLGLVTHRLVKGRVFCRIALSAGELDETRRPWNGAPRPVKLGYTITPA